MKRDEPRKLDTKRKKERERERERESRTVRVFDKCGHGHCLPILAEIESREC